MSNNPARGAEAIITIEDGHVIKDRQPKAYRHPALDERLRTERTDVEARLLEKASQAGVPTPTIIETDDSRVVMDHIDGVMLKTVFAEREDIWRVIGEHIARLHGRNIIHGDLTTSNMLLADETVYFIDFGLGQFSQRTEDRATDLHLLYEVLASTHTAVADDAMAAIMDAYEDMFDDAAAVLQRYEEVGARGRYK